MSEEENYKNYEKYEECENVNDNNIHVVAPPDPKIERTPEEVQNIKNQILECKADANNEFNKGEFLSALNKYTNIIKLAEEIEFKEQLAILNSNRGLCFMKMNDNKHAIENFSKSIECDNKYIKAYVNRMLILNQQEDYIEALEDFNKIKEIDYTIYQKYRHMEKELNYKAEIKKKQMTEEVMGKLKEVGNSFLGLFGLSTNNFNLQQNAAGGYSVQFEK